MSLGSFSHWVSDAEVEYCTGCKRKFDLVNRRHHCRLCGQIFCEICSNWRISIPELDITQGRSCAPCHSYLNNHLPLLANESFFTRYNQDGEPFEIRLKLSRDQEKLVWKSEDLNYAVEESVELDTFKKVIDGQQTEAFAAAKPNCLLTCFGDKGITLFEDKCFTLLFQTTSLDLQAMSVEAKTRWLESFRETIARRSTKGSAVIRTARNEKQEEEIQEKKQAVTQKYSNLQAKYKSKYGSTN